MDNVDHNDSRTLDYHEFPMGWAVFYNSCDIEHFHSLKYQLQQSEQIATIEKLVIHSDHSFQNDEGTVVQSTVTKERSKSTSQIIAFSS